MHSLSSKAVCCKDSLVKVLQKNGGLHPSLKRFQTPESPAQHFLAAASSAAPLPISSEAAFPSV